jgi:hypothetical protein
MRLLRSSMLALAVVGCATAARAQDPSFGAPAMLPLPSSIAPPGYAPYAYGQGDYAPPMAAPAATSTPYARQGGWMPGPHQPAPQATPRAAQAPRTLPARFQPLQPEAVQGMPAMSPGAPDRSAVSEGSPGNCFEQAMAAPAGCGACATCCRPMWFGALGGMVLTRNNPNPVWTSALVSNNANQVLNTVDAMDSWRAGGEVRLGRQLCCGGAWEVTWWTIAPFSAFASVWDPGNLLTPIDLFGVNIGGAPASDFFDNAQEHRIWRRDTFQNVELNWYSLPVALPSGTCTLSWLTGIRYFQFNEGVVFGSVSGGNEFGSDGGINEAYINSQVRNRLLGAQVGAVSNYFIRPRLSLFAMPRFGIFNNWAHEDFQLYRGDGLNAFTIRENQNLVAFLAQIDTGLNWAITPRCSIYGGYRVLLVNGVALADNQFPHFLIDQPEIAHIKPNGNLLLHGAIFGVQFLF